MKSGDMVQLVWACCPGGRKNIGWTGIVQRLGTYQGSKCYCGYKTYGVHAWIHIGTDGVVPVSWLRPVNPPLEQTEDRIVEELSA